MQALVAAGEAAKSQENLPNRANEHRSSQQQHKDDEEAKNEDNNALIRRLKTLQNVLQTWIAECEVTERLVMIPYNMILTKTMIL